MSWKSSLISVIQLKFWNCEAGCSQSAVSKHVHRELSGRKRCTTNRENRSLMRIVKKIDSRIWVNFTRNGLRLGSSIKSTTHRRVEEFGYSCLQRRLTWAKRRRTGLLPSGPKSSFQMRASFVFHLETKVLESGGRVEKLKAQVTWSPVLSFHSLWWFGCNVICWCWSLKQKEPLPSIEYIYSKWTYFPEGQQFTKNVFLLVLWSILISW